YLLVLFLYLSLFFLTPRLPTRSTLFPYTTLFRSYNSPFKFNGKEFDAETGNYYMSARYYSQKYNLMLSVDPASELYPGISPYIFALQNPVRFIDPTGMVVEENPVYDSEGNHRGNTKEGFTGQLIIYNGNMDFSNMSKEELVDNGGKYYEY